MKFSQLGRLALAPAASAALMLGITACGQSNTVDFIYVASSNLNPGQIYAFSADGESGVLRQIQGSPFPAGRNPIALVTSPNDQNVYALNHDDNTVIEYAVGTDGKLYAQNTYNLTAGTNPNGMAISPDGKTLYVVAAYGLDASGTPFSPTTPGIGALLQFPINAGGSLGTETAYPTCNNPVAVNVLANGSAVYVVNSPSGQLATLIDTVAAENRGATGSATVIYPPAGACLGGPNAPQGQITSYVVNSDNSLSPGAGSPFLVGPPNVSTVPVAIATDPSSSFVYVTDFATSQMYTYTVQGSGGLSTLTNSQPTGQSPSAVTIDPTGKYIYVTNYAGNTVSGFSIGPGGVPSALASNATAVEPGPASVLVEDSLGRFLYTGNFIAGTVSSLFLDPNAGTTHSGQNSPFPGVSKATAVASVRHGNHKV